MKRNTIAFILLLMVLSVCIALADEHRALWIHTWGPGIGYPSDVTTMINWTQSANLNAIVPEVRLRADAYYYSTIEPPGTGTPMQSGFDPLQDMINKAHPKGIEVHPWVVVYRVWSGNYPPPSMTPQHIWHTQKGWFNEDYNGNQLHGTVTNHDPGHPEVQDYLTMVFMDIVSRYNIDGFAFDYIRYPGTNWGYNPVAVARYNEEYGTTGKPSSSDARWLEWRRDQVSHLVKRVYLETKAIKPHVKVGGAVWRTWSEGYNSYLQDWEKWMQNGWIDYVSPMMYTSSISTLQGWLDNAWGRRHGRHIYPLLDSSIAVSSAIDQTYAARNKGYPGIDHYVWQTIDRTNLRNALVNGPYPTYVAPADMPWLSAPTQGYLKGFIRDPGGNPIDFAYAQILGTSVPEGKSAGTGFYGFSKIPPGTYTLRVSSDGYQTLQTPVTIAAGQVTHVDITLQAEANPPVISNVRAEQIHATHAQIKWTTDKASTSQVDYGFTSSYGITTTEDRARVTQHTVQLINLVPDTTYHYRVRSYDRLRKVSQSVNFTFKTAAVETVPDVIVDNLDAGFSTIGSWSTAAFGQPWGPDYVRAWTSNQNQSATWVPTILTAGNYDVYIWYVSGDNRSPTVPLRIVHQGGQRNIILNQKINGAQWFKVGDALPFASGTSGNIRITTATGDATSLAVIADAVRLVHIPPPPDTTPPTAPSNLTATAVGTSQINLSWTASTDNVGVAGYRVFRDGAEIGLAITNSYADSDLSANTQHSYYVTAFDAAGNISPPSNTAAGYTWSLPPQSDSILCDKQMNEWHSTPGFTFSAVEGFGPGVVQYYRYAWNKNSTHSWSGSEPQWSSGALSLNATSAGSWYLHVRGYNGANVLNGSYTYGPFNYDDSPPTMGSVDDGGMYTDAAGQLSATWTPASDPQSGIHEYQYAIGTSPGNIGAVLGWTSVGMNTSMTTSGLSLISGTTYFIGVRAKNGAGIWSDAAVSDGITAADVISTVAAAKGLPDGKAIILQDKVVTAGFGSHFYIIDDSRAAGIRVNASAPSQGKLVSAAGILGVSAGERVITAPEVIEGAMGVIPAPLYVTNGALGGAAQGHNPGVTEGVGLNNIGLLVTTSGRVTFAGSGFVYIDDGSAVDDGSGFIGVKVDTSTLASPPTQDQFVTVVGISGAEESGSNVIRLLKPRADADVKTHP